MVAYTQSNNRHEFELETPLLFDPLVYDPTAPDARDRWNWNYASHMPRLRQPGKYDAQHKVRLTANITVQSTDSILHIALHRRRRVHTVVFSMYITDILTRSIYIQL